MKAKIIIPNILVVLFLGIGLYVYLSVVLQRQSQADMSRQLKSLAVLFTRSEALRGQEQLREVTRLSMTQMVTSAFRALPLEQMPEEDTAAYDARLREAWFKSALKSVETVAVTLESRVRVPALVFITDRNGVVLARTTTPNACPAGKNVANALPVVKRALDGEPGFTVWSVNKSPFDGDDTQANHVCTLMNAGLMETAAVPVWGQGDKVVGTLVVGWDVSNGMASDKASELGMALAIVQNGDVYSTSFSTDAEREQLDHEIDAGPASRQLKRVYAGSKAQNPFELVVGGNTYLAFPAALIDTPKNEKLAFLFLASESESSFWLQLKIPVIVFIMFTMLCLFVVGILLGGHFMKPVIEIEEGVLRIINGDTDYRFDVVSDEVGGLSYRINQLVNVLTENDADENGEEEGEVERDGASEVTDDSDDSEAKPEDDDNTVNS